MKKIVLLILVMICILQKPLQAQTYNMSNGSVTTCGGNFYDNGGATGNYSHNQFLVFTVCADQPLHQIQISFSSFDLESGNDYFYIYDGSNTFAPLLGIFSGAVIPGIFTSSNGCLTFVFISNGSINAAGWASSFSCVSSVPPPCSVSGCPAGGSPPLNDACSNATNLGALPTPASCPNGTGTVIGIAGTTSCANAENPFMQQQGCLSANNMPAPAADVWYTFSLTGSELNVQIQGMNSPSAALYQGTNCSNLIGRGCAIGASGALNATFQSLPAGQYYLQVSGGSPADQCNFTLLLKNNRDCNACTVSSNLTASPPPVDGNYSPGQTITFCYTVSSFNQISSNWLHGVVPQFGSGWDINTLTNFTSPNSCSGSGLWSWYNTPVTSSATGTVSGPGFFYETWQGGPSGLADNNPGNNYGDNNPNNNCTWTFCWTINTKTSLNCTNQNDDLTIKVFSYGDGQTGAWSSLACTSDPPVNFNINLECCLTPDLTYTNPGCNGIPVNGSATGSGQGSGPWTYSWYYSNVLIYSLTNQTGPATIDGLIPGNYTFTTTDINGCTSTAYFTITSPTSLNLNISKTNASCGINNGTATAVVTGGSGPISYLWSTTATTASITNLGPGVVTVTATDTNGCAKVVSATITQPSAPVLNVSSTNVNCYGGSNGSASVTPIGGTAPYLYLWSNSQTTSSVNNLPANIYTVTVTDANGCIVTASVIVNQPIAGITASINSLSMTDCNGATGSANVIANGGTSPYYYLWHNGETTSTVSNLPSGNISVTVTDIVGCSSTATGTIAQASPPVVNILSFNNPSCSGENNGDATVNVSRGAMPYSYNWSSGDTGLTALNLISGIHTVTVTDNNGCISTASVILTDPVPISSTIVAQSDVSCFGFMDGSATVSATGGSGNYLYEWSSGSNSAAVTGLPADTYIVIVTDNNGCTDTISVNITQPQALLSLISSNDVNCNGGNDGSAVVLPSGGTIPYSYNWSSGSISSSATGLSANTHGVTITDANGCTTTSSVTISEPSELNASVVTTMANCTANDGTASAIVSGGTGSYSYLWNSGATTATANGLPSGNIQLTVTDMYGCSAVVHSVINVDNSNLSLVVSSVTDVLCEGGNEGEIFITPTGGTAPFNFNWYPAVSNSDNASSLYAGTYTIDVTDSNGCISSQTVIVNEPPPLLLNLSAVSATCGSNNGSASVNVNGGTGNYSYSWSSGSNTLVANDLPQGYVHITVTDANGCFSMDSALINDLTGPVLTVTTINNISCHGANDGEAIFNVSGGTGTITYAWTGNVSSSYSASQLPAGNYEVVATDANGCSSGQQFIITEPGELEINLNATDVLCYGENNGSVTAMVTGGIGSYSFDWLGSNANTPVLNNLSSGSYSVIVSDQNGCTQSTSVNITEPPPVSVITSGDVVICSGQTATLTASGTGGIGTFTYLWDNTITDSVLIVSPVSPASYSVIATDSNGCQSSVQIIQVGHFPALSSYIVGIPMICPGEYIDLTPVVTGGDGGSYSYKWSNGFTSSSINVAPLTATNYSVIVTDGCGSTAVTDIDIDVEPIPLISFIPDKTMGCGELNVNFINNSITTAGSSFLWNFGDNTSDTHLNPVKEYLMAGEYDVSLSVTSPLGCISSMTIPQAVIVHPSPVSVFTYSPQNEISVHNTKVNFLNLSKGADYWNWDFGDGKGTSSDQHPQYYFPENGSFLVSLIVGNTQGCEDTSYQKVKIEDNFSVFFPNTFTPDYDGMNDYFYVYGEGIQALEMKIFDRWGKVIFNTNSINVPWNGRFFNSGEECPVGVYVYMLLVTDSTGKIHSYNGTINLIR
jgi:gliding motility-associated-like protein